MNGEVAIETDLVGILAQESGADRVKRAGSR